MDFPKQFSGAKVITLEQNFRSTQPILDLTNEIQQKIEENGRKMDQLKGQIENEQAEIAKLKQQ